MLGEALRRVQPVHFADLMIEKECIEEPRSLTEILDSIEELVSKVWYNRHHGLRNDIERGKIKIVEKVPLSVKNDSRRPVQCDIWESALRAAARVEEKYGLENLGPWSDFEWGMINAFSVTLGSRR
jgi:hypothetical protein